MTDFDRAWAAIHHRQHEIENDHLGCEPLVQLRPCLLAGGGNAHGESLVPEQRSQVGCASSILAADFPPLPLGRLRPPLRFEPPDHPLACTPCKSFGSRAAQPLLAAPKNPHRTAYPLNGSRNNTVGAILDASVRAGYVVSPRATVWLDIRYLGGGATNTDPNDYAKNWLHFLFVGVGASYDLVPPK